MPPSAKDALAALVQDFDAKTVGLATQWQLRQPCRTIPPRAVQNIRRAVGDVPGINPPILQTCPDSANHKGKQRTTKFQSE